MVSGLVVWCRPISRPARRSITATKTTTTVTSQTLGHALLSIRHGKNLSGLGSPDLGAVDLAMQVSPSRSGAVPLAWRTKGDLE